MNSGKRLRMVIFGSAAVAVLMLTLLVEKKQVRAAGIFTVTNTNDAGTGSLRQAITDANSMGGGTIDATGVSGPIFLLTALPNLDSNLTINGGGHVIVARSLAGGTPDFGIFVVNTAKIVVINALFIQNGKAPKDFPGGGIANNGGTLTISNCGICCNSTSNVADGGGIANNGGTLTVNNSAIGDNSASGGGGIANAGTLTVNNTIISNNSASGGGGGGILTTHGTLIVSNSHVVQNFDTGGGGGGIFIQGTAKVTNSTVAHNSVVLNIGGGIVNQGALTVSNSTVANNSTDSIFGGGGIVNSGMLTINNSTVTNNSATTGGGGGIAQFLGSVNLQSSIVAKNSGASPDVSGAFTSLGHNLIGNTSGNSGSDISQGDFINVDPLFELDAMGNPWLKDNGGPRVGAEPNQQGIPTIALLPGSPAIDHGRNTAPPLLTDQRGLGFARTFDDSAVGNGTGDGTDIGAFEVQLPCNSIDYTFTQATGASIVPGTTDTSNHCDDCTTEITLPFAFTLYDQTFTTARISSNGNLQFVGSNSDFESRCLPSPDFGYTIFGLWDDLFTQDAASGQGVFTSISGSAPNRIFNIEWRAKFCCDNGAPIIDFEIRLYENSTRFDLVYGEGTNMSSRGSVGLQRTKWIPGCFTSYSCLNPVFPGLSLTVNPGSFICVQDESNGNMLQFNTTTGEYQFTNCSAGLVLAGTGSLIKRGGVITLQHFAADRRVLAQVVTGVNRGTASIQVFSQGTTFTIMDRNTLNNTCTCP